MNEFSPNLPPEQKPERESNEFADLHELINELESSLTSASDNGGRESALDDIAIRENASSDPRLTHVPRWRWLHLVLFVLTCLSTFYVGGIGQIPPEMLAGNMEIPAEVWSELVTNGLMYAGAVMAILLAHEMGHYLQARRYHVAASPPYFIPMPFTPLGTMGAVILQYSGYADRKKLYDIAISGPLAGLVLALPIACQVV